MVVVVVAVVVAVIAVDDAVVVADDGLTSSKNKNENRFMLQKIFKTKFYMW